MPTKVVSLFIFFQELSNTKKIKALRPKMTKVASRGSCLKVLSRCQLVGSCVRPGENFFSRPTTMQVCTFDTFTGNLAVNSVFVSIYERHEQVSLFFIFSKLFYRFLYHGDQMISWWRISRWLVVNFEIHRCSSGVNSDLGECFFWGLCKPVIASTDL